MKKKLCLFFACAITTVMLFGCGNSSEQTTEDTNDTASSAVEVEFKEDGSLPPLEKDLQQLYQEAYALYEQIALTGFEMDTSKTMETDGLVYYKVNDSRFSDYDSFYAYLNQYFTKDFIDEEILSENNLRFAKGEDGSLYILDGGRGTNIFFAGYVMTLDSQTEKEIKFTATVYNTSGTTEPNTDPIFYTEPENPDQYTTTSYQFNMIQEDGNWKFDSFYLFY